jgi:Rod binding domain-containing protein
MRPGLAAQRASEEALREAARAFEAAFLSEMLRHSGHGRTPEAFGGGIGEEQFASLLTDAQASEMAQSGGVGLAEYIVTSLRERTDG